MGLSITIAPVIAIVVVHFALIPGMIDANQAIDPDDKAWAVSVLRKDLLDFHAWIAGVIAIYWLLMVLFARGEFLRPRSANITLLLSGSALASLNLLAPLGLGEPLKSLCPVLGISDTLISFGFDAQSPCEVFADTTYSIILVGLLGLLVISFVFSAVSRIVVSRRLLQADVANHA